MVRLASGKRYGFILTEDSQGFFDYSTYTPAKAREVFDRIAQEVADEEDSEEIG